MATFDNSGRIRPTRVRRGRRPLILFMSGRRAEVWEVEDLLNWLFVPNGDRQSCPGAGRETSAKLGSDEITVPTLKGSNSFRDIASRNVMQNAKKGVSVLFGGAASQFIDDRNGKAELFRK